MIHLDTNFLVNLVTIGSPGGLKIPGRLKAGKAVTTRAVAWSAFCNGALSKLQKDAAFTVLDQKIADFQRLVRFGLVLEGWGCRMRRDI